MPENQEDPASREAELFEHKVGDQLIRISRGPGEAASIGSYAIRVFDSEGLSLLAGDVLPREGAIAKTWAWATGKEEASRIAVWTQSAGSGSYGRLDVFQFSRSRLSPVKLPDPRPEQLEGYMGHDRFQVKDGVIFRQFPVFLPGRFERPADWR